MMIPPPYLDVIDRIWTCRHANEDYQVSNISELYTDTQTQTHNISSSNLKSLLKSSVNAFVIWADWDVNLYNHSIPPFCSKSASRRGHPQKWPFCYIPYYQHQCHYHHFCLLCMFWFSQVQSAVLVRPTNYVKLLTRALSRT